MARAAALGLTVPAFNVPYLPMVEPVIEAVRDQNAFAFVATARLEWSKFASQGPAAVMREFSRWNDPDHVRLHLDHVPAVDEDGQEVDYLPILEEAIALGFHSLMFDGSRLELEANVEATRRAVELAHRAGLPCEAELGAVLGHEAGPLPPYEELFQSGLGFTDPEEAARFVGDTGCDWLSVAIGNVHGAVSGALREQKKVEARLDLNHLQRLRRAVGVPLVLHGGSGVRQEDIRAAMKQGIAKVNVATEIRQPYEAALGETGSLEEAQRACYERTSWLIGEYLGLAGSRPLLAG